MRKFLVSLAMLLALIKQCFADPIPAQHQQAFNLLQIIVPIAINYAWNFAILGFTLHELGVMIGLRFALFILTLTVLGFVIDFVTYFLTLSLGFGFGFGFIFWVIFAGLMLFLLAFSLTKVFFKLSERRCAIAGAIYAIASNPAIGILFVLPLLSKFSLFPPL